MNATRFATLATFQLDLSREAEQKEGLARMIVPGVKASPGFVSGCWTLDRERSESVVLVTFDTIDHAELFADNVKANAQGQAAVGISLESIKVVEVSASA